MQLRKSCWVLLSGPGQRDFDRPGDAFADARARKRRSGLSESNQGASSQRAVRGKGVSSMITRT